MNDDLDPVSLEDFLHESLSSKLRSGLVSIDKTDPPSIDIRDPRQHPKNLPYQVVISRIKSPADAAGWIAQLHAKTWVTDVMLRDFIEVLDRLGKLR